MTSFSLGISPCPNDTYIFGALVNGWLENAPDITKCEFEDVEFLNKAAMTAGLDVIKISYSTYPKISEDYQLLTAGGALGKNCGPLLISRMGNSLPTENSVIAIPGWNTTANLLLSLALPDCSNKIEILFSDIEEAVASGRVDFGLIIHESRFTYAQKGLFKILDLGEFWDQRTNTPLPLGAIAVRRNMPTEVKKQINNAVKESIEYANNHKEEILNFAKNYAQEMDEEIMKAHINLYVNEYSLDVGPGGKKAVNLIFEEMMIRNPGLNLRKPVFIDD